MGEEDKSAAAPAAAGGTAAAGTPGAAAPAGAGAAGAGKYVPPSRRDGAGRIGESMNDRKRSKIL